MKEQIELYIDKLFDSYEKKDGFGVFVRFVVSGSEFLLTNVIESLEDAKKSLEDSAKRYQGKFDVKIVEKNL